MITSERPMLDLDTFISQCAPNKQAMIYGLNSCKFGYVARWLKIEKASGRFMNIFGNVLGSNKEEDPIYKELFNFEDETFDRGKIAKIKNIAHKEGEEEDIHERCKNAEVNLIIENVKRTESGLPIIPLIFVVKLNDTVLKLEKILDKLPKKTADGIAQHITDAEIRRAYRLCSDPYLHKEIREVAKNTFIFIALETNPKDASVMYSFKKIEAPWNSGVWQEGWCRRKNLRQLPKEHVSSWKIQANNLVEAAEESKSNTYL